MRAKHNRREQGVHVPVQTQFLKSISSYVFLLLWVGGLGRKEGRKESKNLWFILESHTPETLFVYFVPAHLCIVCPAYVLWPSHSKPLLLLKFLLPCLLLLVLTLPITAASCTSSSVPLVPGSLDLSPNLINLLTWQKPCFAGLVNRAGTELVQTGKAERERSCLQQERRKALENTDFPSLSLVTCYIGSYSCV